MGVLDKLAFWKQDEDDFSSFEKDLGGDPMAGGDLGKGPVMPGDEKICLSAGANDYITKPIKMTLLKPLIHYHLFS